jgi:DNA-binding response OmpR family regulator
MHKILAIDDDGMMLDMYKALFCKPEFELRVAKDAMMGIALFKSFNPDLLILDVNMPAGGGEAMYQRVRKVFLSDLPILFYTGSPKSVQQLACLPNVDVIEKPASPDTIFSAAKVLLKIQE